MENVVRRRPPINHQPKSTYDHQPIITKVADEGIRQAKTASDRSFAFEATAASANAAKGQATYHSLSRR